MSSDIKINQFFNVFREHHTSLVLLLFSERQPLEHARYKVVSGFYIPVHVKYLWIIRHMSTWKCPIQNATGQTGNRFALSAAIEDGSPFCSGQLWSSGGLQRMHARVVAFFSTGPL